MRHLRAVSLAFLSALTLSSACGGGASADASITGNTTGNNTNTSCTSKFSATVNGTSWCALSPVAHYYAAQQQVVFSGINLGGSAAATWSITLSASAITASGTYNLTTLTPLRFAVAGSGSGVGYSTANAGGSGTITFTSFSTTHIVGTFTFTAPATTSGGGSITVTNGSFDLNLTPAN